MKKGTDLTQYELIVRRLLEGGPTAQELEQHLEVLRAKRAKLESMGGESTAPEKRRLDKMIRALGEAKAISEFVELQVRRGMEKAGMEVGEEPNQNEEDQS